MARLTDPEILARYKQALCEWRVSGAILLLKDGYEGLRTTLEGVTEAAFKEALYRYVCEQDGEIKQVKEDRHRWREEWAYHYDLCPTINSVRVYVETRLHPESFSSREEPEIHIVHVKPDKE